MARRALVTVGESDEVALAKGVPRRAPPVPRPSSFGAAPSAARTFDAAAVTRLATLPPREVLLAQLAGGFASPLPTMAGLLAAPLRNLGYALSAAARQREAASGRRLQGPHLDTTHTHKEGHHHMATITQDQILEAIDGMTVLELSDFIKKFEERYGVTAAAPAAAAAAGRRPPAAPPLRPPPRSRPSSAPS